MKKTCPACGARVLDPSKQFCSKCENLPQVLSGKLSREDFEQISQTVSKRLKGDWRFKVQIVAVSTLVVLSVVLTVIGVVDAIVGFNLRDKVTEHFQTLETQATNKINTSLASLDDDVQKTLAQVDGQMRSNIAHSFETTNIQAVIQDVAKDEARRLLEKEVQPAVTSFKEEALFMRTIARAQGYDFKAYQVLIEIGKGTDENAKLANQVLDELDRALARDRSDFSPKRHLVIFSGTNFYNGPFTSDEIAQRFQDTLKDQTSFNREGFVNSAVELKQPLFMSQFMEFFTNETDLGVADRLTIAISDLAKQDFRPRDFERIQTWWISHQAEYTNWPVSECRNGQIKFATGRHIEALESFRNVLALDPLADQSRAFAIACSLKTGNTNSAMNLLKGFKQPDARWAQWASAFVELETGSVSNATVRFADLKKKQPMMIPLPTQEANGWNKIDWALFNRLISSDKP